MKGAFLHDVGKIGISDNILLKNTKLNEDEWKEMKLHPTLGAELIGDLPWFKDALDIVLYHHEKFDGSGYSDGLKGNEIPINARLFAVIDVFDTLVSKRPYKEAIPMNKALKIIKSEKGTHFDPIMVDLFCENINNIYEKVYHASEYELNQLLTEKRKKNFWNIIYKTMKCKSCTLKKVEIQYMVLILICIFMYCNTYYFNI